uniref:Uncharacterized protein n=1 Tax=Candidatus Kentrum sp. MB TaxID=2138164 RepID=A0A450XI97_9GAMM|nr:MAG: hypothetical protein BECKMB1821I_GA0114274_10083 [Candidatus Kentron sp. MB]VFK31468.1 MAG: hypothetical protein BECKMB1821G_GA0114241_10853 [Candidatus Kentron sp. MB]VFK74644.1 MAG: hypothetical protein BECKMB1821H_GA0114242_10083 [Candidatus Kentron sp. MB]
MPIPRGRGSGPGLRVLPSDRFLFPILNGREVIKVSGAIHSTLIGFPFDPFDALDGKRTGGGIFDGGDGSMADYGTVSGYTAPIRHSRTQKGANMSRARLLERISVYPTDFTENAPTHLPDRLDTDPPATFPIHDQERTEKNQWQK